MGRALSRSVGNDDYARWCTQRLYRAFGSSVNLNTRFRGLSSLIVSAGPVELSIAQHDAALGENGTLQFRNGSSIGSIGQLPGNALSQDFRRPALPSGFDQILISLGSDASIEICVFADLRCIIRQIGEFVQDDFGFEVTNRADQCRSVENITKNWFGTELGQGLLLAGRASHSADHVPGLNQPGNQPLPKHARCPRQKYSHTISPD